MNPFNFLIKKRAAEGKPGYRIPSLLELCRFKPEIKGDILFPTKDSRFRLRALGISKKQQRLQIWARSCYLANRIQEIRQASQKKVRPNYWQAGMMLIAALKSPPKQKV